MREALRIRRPLGQGVSDPGQDSCSLSDVCQMSKSKTSSSPAHYDFEVRPTSDLLGTFAFGPPKCRPGAPKTPPRRSRDAPETPSAVSWLFRRHLHALRDDFGVKTVPKWSPNGAPIHRKFTSIRRPRSESKFACFPTGPLRSYILLPIRKL